MGLHNAQILQQTLPHTLTAPSYLHHDCQLYHDTIALDLHALQEKKRKKAKGKAQATCQANKDKKKIDAGEALGIADCYIEHEDQMDEGMSDILDNAGLSDEDEELADGRSGGEEDFPALRSTRACLVKPQQMAWSSQMSI